MKSENFNLLAYGSTMLRFVKVMKSDMWKPGFLKSGHIKLLRNLKLCISNSTSQTNQQHFSATILVTRGILSLTNASFYSHFKAN